MTHARLLRRVTRCGSVLVVACAALALLLLPAIARARPAYYGANNFYFWRTDPNSVFQFADLGANTARLGVDWSQLERGPGQPRFDPTQSPSGGSCANWAVYPGFPSCTDVVQGLDDRVAQYSANGITPLLSVGGTPSGWRESTCAADPDPNKGSCFPGDPNTYASFVYNLALRYAMRGTPVMIEVYNESDAEAYRYPSGAPLPSYCAPDTSRREACEYARVVKATKTALLQGDSRVRSAKLLAGALGWTAQLAEWETLARPWLLDLLRNGAVQNADGLSYHTGAQTSDNTQATYLIVDMLVNKIRPLLHFFGQDSKEAWATELMRSPGSNDMLDEERDRDFYSKVLPALDRARYDVGGGQTIKALQGVIPYELHDDASCPNPSHNYCSGGLYRYPPPILNIKPSGNVVKFLYHYSGAW